MKLLQVSFLASLACAKEFFRENFSDGDKWTSRWVQSKHKSDYGALDLSAGTIYAEGDEALGLRTPNDAKFYAMSSRFEPFNNEGQDLVIQYSVKHDQKIDCGGGYVKIFPKDLEQEEMHGESDYHIMFGPDICGYSTKKVHVIFNYEGKNHLIKEDIKCKDDEYTHVYTLHVKPDNTYEVFIDGASAKAGSLEEHWDMLKPKKIKDPEAKKPEDWVDDAKIDDPEDTKPSDWDDEPEYVADPDAEKPEDWDDEMDGEWEAPMINNPEFKGEWSAKQIDNPDYKGPWVHPEIDNPEYKEDKSLYSFKDISVIGLDLWQVKAGSVFDNFVISDDIQAALKEAKQIVEDRVEAEKKMKEELDAAKKAEEPEEDDDEEDVDDEDFEDFDEDEFDGHDEL